MRCDNGGGGDIYISKAVGCERIYTNGYFPDFRFPRVCGLVAPLQLFAKAQADLKNTQMHTYLT